MNPAQANPDSPFLTSEEVAVRYRTSPSSVRFWSSRGDGPRSMRIGKRRLYRLDDLIIWEQQLAEMEAAK